MIVLSGASGGIGRATALALAARGEHLVLTARDPERLEHLAHEVADAGGTASIQPCDLRDQQAVEELVRTILRREGVPRALLLLAGHSIRRSLPETFGRPHDLVRVTGTNLLGPATLTLGLLGAMYARGEGRIVAVTSATARIPTPGWAAYGASKAALDSWLRALRPEAAAGGVSLAIVEIPLVATTMSAPTYGSVPRGALGAEQAAQQVLRALDDPRRTLLSPWWARVAVPLVHAFPAAGARVAGLGGRLARRRGAGDRAPGEHA